MSRVARRASASDASVAGWVMFEIALSCGLLVAAGLTIKSVTKLGNMNPGFTTKNVFTARVGFPAAYTDTVAQARFFDQAVQRVAALPGVQSAAIAVGLPGAQQGFGGTRFSLEGATYAKDQDRPNTRLTSVSPGFFSTLNIPIVAGRGFTDADREGSLPVAVVTRSFVAKHFKDKDPIGRRVRFGEDQSRQPWLTVVGIAGDLFTGDQQEPFSPVLFQPLAQARSGFAYITARTVNAPMSLTAGVRTAVASLNPDIPLYWVQTLDTAIAQQLWFVRVFGTMFVIFGGIALFLASVGLYAVMSFSVSRRIREVGIRMALGAQARDVVGMIFRQGIVQLAIGMALGLALAFGIARLLGVILFQVQPRDPVIFSGVAAVLVAVGMLACLVPARRATLVDPLVALRAD